MPLYSSPAVESCGSQINVFYLSTIYLIFDVQLLRFSIFQSLSPRADTSVKCFIYTRAMVKFLWRCDGDNLFLKAMQYRYFLDLTIVDHDMFFFTIFDWFSCLPKVLSWSSCFLFGFHGRSRYFHVFFISLSLPLPTTQFLI